jgi:tetratricopeptide (TPR) repeat protein
MFDELQSLAEDPGKLLTRAAQSLVESGDAHRLFELRLLEERRRLGLALDRRTPIDEIEEPLRSQLEAAYLSACREVGELLLEAGRLREAWMYLRPAGDKLAMRRRLARVTAEGEQADGLIELALFEGIDPERGYAWLLGRQGTCSGITTLDGLEQQLSVAEVRACAAVLVRHVYNELLGNLRGHLHRLAGAAPPQLGVRDLIDQHPELQAGGDYHLDPSHLASAMRYARMLTEPGLVAKALEMAEYGARLPADLQYRGEPPFEEVYRTHGLLLRATLGQDVDEALEYFGSRARSEKEADGGESPSTAAVETYLVLLARTGRYDEALTAYRTLTEPGRDLSRYAPTLLELAEASGAWDEHAEICRQRKDVLAFTAGLLARYDQGASGTSEARG